MYSCIAVVSTIMILFHDLLFPLPLLLIIFPQSSLTLTCFCTNQFHCPDSQCITDGVCRTFIKRKPDSSVVQGYHCIDKNKLFPPERPFSCENSKTVEKRYKHQCCDKLDYCNLNISLVLEKMEEEGEQEEDEELMKNSKHSIYIVITVLASTVVLLATGCIVYIVRLSRAGPHNTSHLPCLKYYSEVETKSADDMSTTTLQVHSVQLLLAIILLYSRTGCP